MHLLSSCGGTVNALAEVRCEMNLQLECSSHERNAETRDKERRKLYCESCALLSGKLKGKVLPVWESEDEDLTVSNNIHDILHAHNEREKIHAHEQHANASFGMRGSACCTTNWRETWKHRVSNFMSEWSGAWEFIDSSHDPKIRLDHRSTTVFLLG